MLAHDAPLEPEVASVLADAAAFDWAALSHAHGDATDVPAMLEALATGQDSSDLWGSICHQGTVYPASAATVPFLARLVAAGAAVEKCLWLLGAMAESDDTPSEAEDVRAALREQVGNLAPLLGHAEAAIRQAAVFAVGQARLRDLVPTLRDRLAHDEAPAVRAEALIGLACCGGPDMPALVVAALGDKDEAVRLVGVVTALDSGVRWDDTLHEALLSVADPDGVGKRMLADGWDEPLVRVVEALCSTGQAAAAARFLTDAADRQTVDIAAVLCAASCACEASRRATQLLRPLAARYPALAARLLEPDPPLSPQPDRSTDRRLGADARLGVQGLRSRLAQPLPDDARLNTATISHRIALAEALWEQTGDATPVVAVVAEVVACVAGRDLWIWGRSRAEAARAAARIGPAAAPLERVLRPLLDDATTLAAAATALIRAGCDLDVEDVATRLADHAGADHAGLVRDDTVAALAALAPLLSETAKERWRRVIDQDARLVRGRVAADEQYRAALGQALAGR